jgi:segregation and condensation protein B
MDDAELMALVEAHLFVSTEPVRPAEVARTLGLDLEIVDFTYASLYELYKEREDSGLRIVRLSGGYQMVTHPDLSENIARLLALPKESNRLSKPALETVAVIAYRQPVTQAEIEAVRGVTVDGVLKTLSDRQLIREAGRKPVPGRPILYGTTPEFLHYFGLNDISDLPSLDDIEMPADPEAMSQALEAVGLEG